MLLEGTLERITFQSDDDGYLVARLTPSGKAYLVTIVGKLIGVRPGETLSLEGEWQEHREHGRQFLVSGYHTLMPATIDGMRRYLGSGLIKGVGPSTAKKITETFGKYTLDVLDREPDRLVEVPGLGRRKVEVIKAAWRSQQQIKEVMLFLQDLGLPTGLAVRIYKQYGDAAMAVVRDTPYRLADEVYGIGFLTADKIAAGLGVAPDDPQRIGAGLRHTLGQATDDGHCYLPAGELTRRATDILDITEDLAAEGLQLQIADCRLQVDGEPGSQSTIYNLQSAIYLPPLAMAETGVAAAIIRQARAPSDIAGFYAQARWGDVFAHLAERREIRLSERQQDAVRMALTSKVSVLTGGPGTGKTMTLRAVTVLLAARGYRCLLASPTGRAAKRLTEATGAPARTIHRLLEYAPGASGLFRRNADWPLECDLLVIDEVSMLDVLLANHLLKALPPQAHLLLVGDADQLPSVGPGRVLRDLLDSGAVPSVHLHEIFRQAAGSGIAESARRINLGEPPEFSGHSDFFFFAAAEAERCAQMVVELVAERIPRRFGLDPRRDIQVLSPTHKGPAGVLQLNKLLQEALNPEAPGKIEKRFGMSLFRTGDRVIQQRNNYDLDVYNGDVGVVAAIDHGEEQLHVQFEDGRSVPYDFAILDELALAYALSVHKSQGGEYPAIVLPMLMQHYAMLQRNLLYTAVTRARQLAVIAGDRRAVARAVANHEVQDRYSGLAGRLRGGR
ncbi:ATP-dependent RecD-like DNA helicase [Oscillochloris sp. ZM17-4]|uniref:SF1B family DNA helicase RecD2 n=1 Tax=Oscillochloris sp. ZM17-4 TaxID=2866714 RepID=UPI001C72A9F7|nr:ATP-dependent RecD-like DNA helicase [Oscillochloris sp. ZM17-4]MBX0327651.1 ATP-dependent RecD-like DNA helicase [Oscillochloris sp. ZM17-4]